ncbi:MAG: VOC family protein [Methylocella sp.]
MQILRVMARSYVGPDGIDAAITFYEHLLGAKCDMRFSIAEAGIELAAIGNMSIASGSEASLAPFRSVSAEFFVDSVVEFRGELAALGVAILLEPTQGPYGKFMIARHPDGLVVEYADGVTQA